MLLARLTSTMAVAALLLFGAPAFGIVVFSYDASTGQFPTDQGWLGFEIDTTGPLTDPSPGGAISGTSAVNANAAIELVDGVNTLHIRDTLTDSTADLPEFYYPWTTGQQLTLINNGLKFTMVLQGLTNATINGAVRFGFNGTEFELQNANIGPDSTIEVTNFGGGLFPIDGAFHTLVITGQKSGANFDFSYTVDAGSSNPLNIITNPAPSAFESTVYFGALSSGGRNTDLLVKSVVMETLVDVQSQAAVVERTNNSPYGTLTFTNNSGPITIVGYSVLSNGGALHPGQWTSIADTYDLSGDQSVDNNDEWIKLTDSASRTDLGEFEPDGDGAVIGTGQSISLGNVWIQNPTEDISMELLLIDGSILSVPIQFTGNGGNPFNFGELDFDGDFDVDDFNNKFVPGFGANTSALSLAEKYQAGDFNGDDVVDEFDFLIYNAAYLTANPGAASLSFSSVPEPGALALLASGVFAWTLFRRRSRGLPPAGLAVVLLVVGGLCALPAPMHAANPIAYWNFNEPGGATALNDLIGANHSTSIGMAAPGAVGQIGGAWTFDGSLSGIAIDAGTGTLTGLGFNYSFSAWVKSTDSLGAILSISDNTEGSEEVLLRVSDNGAPDGRAGLLGRPNIDGPLGEALSTTFVNDDKWHHVAFTSNPTGWSIYVDGVFENSGSSPTSPSAIGANTVHIGVNEDSGGLQWGLLGTLDDISVWDGPLTDGEVANLYVKGLFGRGAIEDFTDALSLEVNRTGSGAITFKNTSGTAFEIDLYRIVSDGNSLQASNWDSLDNQNFDFAAWTELADGNGKVSEGAFGGSTLLAGGFSGTLGNLYNTSVDAQDLAFEYHVVGTPAQLLLRGNVNYVVGGVAGDYNDNGVVDAADYTVWRDHLGQSFQLANEGSGQTPGSVTIEDYNYWKSRFGATSGTGSGATGVATSVPEPASLWLCVGAVAMMGCRRLGRGVRALATLGLLLAILPPAAANVTNDRDYQLGDDPSENGSLGTTVGSSTGGVTFDSAGSSGAGDFQDLIVNGNPMYVDASARPGAAGTNRGASFDGVADSLSTAISFNAPSNMWDNPTFFPATPFPHNYETIFAHGIQLWAKPNASALGQNHTQGIVFDTLEQGIFITQNDTWGLWYDVATGPGIDSGVPVDTVTSGGWTHLMQLGGADDPINGKSRLVGAMLVNGVAVATLASDYDADASPLVIGAMSDGTGGQLNHYAGVLDGVRLFLWGDNTGQNSGDGRLGQNWGTLDLAVDNDWIQQKLASLGVTSRADVNLNGVVLGDGTGPAATDDVTAFVQGWRSRRLVNGVQVGDWISRQNGDLNYDGIVNLRDAAILRQGLLSAGTGSLDFRLLDRNVPEPATVALAALGACCLLHWKLRSRTSRVKASQGSIPTKRLESIT